MGDFHYENISSNDPKAFQQAYDKVLASPRQSALYRAVPIVYMWDDHDFGANNSDGTSASKPAALEAYQVHVPHYPLQEVRGTIRTIQQSFQVGRFRFIVTDLRSERSPTGLPDGAQKSMLGIEQRNWLIRELEGAAERRDFVVWVNTVPWITREDEQSEEGWAPFSAERTWLADHFKKLSLTKRMVVLSGDGHMAAIDDGSHSNYASDAQSGERGFPVVQAAPLDRFPQVKGGPYSHGVAARQGVLRLFGLIKEQQFGLMDVVDDGEVVEITLTARSASGEVLKGLELRLQCREECAVVK
jgi:alkaline phosphatase D